VPVVVAAQQQGAVPAHIVLVTQGVVLGLLVNVAMRPGYEVSREPFRYVVR
jgi:hypothetical protein